MTGLNPKDTQYEAMNRKPVILHWFPDFGSMGGIERYILLTSEALRAGEGFEPLIACSKGTPLFWQLTQAGLPVVGIKTLSIFKKPALRIFDLLTAWQLFWLLQRKKPDIVHIHIGQAENLLFPLLGYPTVYTFHGYSTLYSLENTSNAFKRFVKKQMQPMFHLLVSKLKALLFVSQSEQVRMQKEGYLPADYQGEILHNGIEIEKIQQRVQHTHVKGVRLSMNIPDTSRIISFIGRLDSNKDPLGFITLAEHLGNFPAFEDVHFLIAGSGPLLDQVHAAIRKSKLANRIHLLGYQEDVAKLLAISNLTVSLSRMEGFGLSVLEAAAVGVPCVAYDVGGIAEILSTPKLSMLLVQPESLQTMANRCSQILMMSVEEQEALSQELKAQASQYDLKTMIEKLEAIYSNILASK